MYKTSSTILGDISDGSRSLRPPKVFTLIFVVCFWRSGNTTVARLAITDDKAATALSLDLASKIVTVLDCGIEDLMEVVETP